MSWLHFAQFSSYMKYVIEVCTYEIRRMFEFIWNRKSYMCYYTTAYRNWKLHLVFASLSKSLTTWPHLIYIDMKYVTLSLNWFNFRQAVPSTNMDQVEAKKLKTESAFCLRTLSIKRSTLPFGFGTFLFCWLGLYN